MYTVRTPNYRKRDMAMRWALPDRVFFAAGACHILAYAFVERHGTEFDRIEWIRPASGFTGNHIFVSRGDLAFDYHGVCRRTSLLAHYRKVARRRFPGWRATLVDLPPEVLISNAKSRTYEGLWLREPRQFLHDALPRARAFLDRKLGAIPCAMEAGAADPVP